MGLRFNSKDDIQAIAQELRSARLARAMTLQVLASETGVDSGQLSRFENGKFRTHSHNLQIVLNFLQIRAISFQANDSKFNEQLSARVECFASRSTVHRAVVEEILNALEKLG